MKSLRRETAQEILKDYQALMSVEEVAEALRCVTRTVRNLISAGHLECTRVGRTILVSRDSVFEYLCRPVAVAHYSPREK